MGKAEEGLMVLLKLPPNNINNTQRLGLLRRAFDKQSTMEVTASFVEVETQKFITPIANTDINCQTSIEVVNAIPAETADDEVKKYCSIFIFLCLACYICMC